MILDSTVAADSFLFHVTRFQKTADWKRVDGKNLNILMVLADYGVVSHLTYVLRPINHYFQNEDVFQAVRAEHVHRVHSAQVSHISAFSRSVLCFLVDLQ